MTDTATKHCRGCGQDKPLTEFYRAKRHPDGHRAQCKDCYNAVRRPSGRAWMASYRAAHPKPPPGPREYKTSEAVRAAVLARSQRLRAAVFDHYGRQCACCGRTDDLSIDHVNGDGRRHRDELFGRQEGSVQFYYWLVSQRFPDGYQVLCRPCNTSKGGGERCRLRH